METTTGMSAPPMAITMWIPNNKAITVITASGMMPSWMVWAFMNAPPK